jgi:cytoskeletal protein CcmA (bactofilin family)
MGQSVAENDTAMVETVITKGTTINGSIDSDCSLNIMGTINGDIQCLGKLTVSGCVNGNSVSHDAYIKAEKLQGDLKCDGTVEISKGTVMIGNIDAKEGNISGAVKGQINVDGPVVLDSSAVVKGDVKAKSIQVKTGAVLEGNCSFISPAVDLDKIFG